LSAAGQIRAAGRWRRAALRTKKSSSSAAPISFDAAKQRRWRKPASQRLRLNDFGSPAWSSV
jgi:hypothetical protein